MWGEAGGLSSPRLFNLYINDLLEELSSSGVGCSIDGKFVNNISYADDMVLLCPSVRALQMLVDICERYAAAHGLRYNVKKSEILVFKAGTKKLGAVPPVKLLGIPLNKVTKFKYLGHWVTETLSDDTDIEHFLHLQPMDQLHSKNHQSLRVQYNNAFTAVGAASLVQCVTHVSRGQQGWLYNNTAETCCLPDAQSTREY
ncbi:uncharacterized protein LOC133529812 [Cydia pomonella]|uniref:uncharacterized protein LOC133529812 n=1 Tax=Cydia pomonella TaxID=82600 RepID=UPI002ADD7053|nr:uncharacterized protein LOC133529812 [Cydia pomonella]